jgi:uncharacterized protein YkwD
MLRLTLCLFLAMAATEANACRIPDAGNRMIEATLQAINEERASKGLAALARDPRLSKAAQSHACDSAARNRMGHEGSDGSTLGDRANRAGYRYREVAENVAQGYPSAASVVQGWMASRGHRRNILMRGAEDAGIGLAVGGTGDLHWVLVLGRD